VTGEVKNGPSPKKVWISCHIDRFGFVITMGGKRVPKIPMAGNDWLAQQFEASRGHLRAVAYRMLGSLSEADDAVQECWLRLIRRETNHVENLQGWLTTVVARICLDILRSRRSRREDSLEAIPPAAIDRPGRVADPEAEAILADSVGYAMLVMLDRLSPGERIAFVLHDLFDVPFDEIARIAQRTPEGARQLASRARRRIHRAAVSHDKDLTQQWKLAEEFLAALRLGDPLKLMNVLDPQFSVEADSAAAALSGSPTDIHGKEAWARRIVGAGKTAKLARLALVEGSVGLIVAPAGRLLYVLRLSYAGGLIASMEVIAGSERLRTIEIGDLRE
jgi:RNA polymerase sigma factor (sigma-70 family)